MTFKLKSQGSSFKMMGSSPVKDMKTGSYKQSFESPAKQKKEEVDKFLEEQHEEPVKRSDLDAKGKAIYDKHRAKKKQVALSKHEKKKGTIVTGGSKSEEIIDLEDRIEFLNSDIADESSIMKKGKMISQRNKLKARLKQMK